MPCLLCVAVTHSSWEGTHSKSGQSGEAQDVLCTVQALESARQCETARTVLDLLIIQLDLHLQAQQSPQSKHHKHICKHENVYLYLAGHGCLA